MHKISLAQIASMAILGFSLNSALAQDTWDTAFTGEDGALVISGGTEESPLVVNFDPNDTSLNADGVVMDADGDGTYRFSSITIAAFTTLKITAEDVGWTPLNFLSTGPVVIGEGGGIDISGEDGDEGPENGNYNFTMPGPGGFPGGYDAGTGYGVSNYLLRRYHRIENNTQTNVYLQPLTGGGGYQGDTNFRDEETGEYRSESGGAGGGAMLLASQERITINGLLNTNGGMNRGSGGAFRIVAPVVEGDGFVEALGGGGGEPNVAYSTTYTGWIRLEAEQDNFAGELRTSADKLRRLALVRDLVRFPAVRGRADARLVSINGIEVPANPDGSFANPNDPDVAMDSNEDVIFEVETYGIPAGTQINIFLWNENEYLRTLQTEPLESRGTPAEPVTTTLSTRVRPGWNRAFIYTSWGTAN